MPFPDSTAIDRFDEKLHDTTFFNQMVNIFIAFHSALLLPIYYCFIRIQIFTYIYEQVLYLKKAEKHGTLNVHVKSIMRQMIDDELGADYTWTGQDGFNDSKQSTYLHVHNC